MTVSQNRSLTSRYKNKSQGVYNQKVAAFSLLFRTKT